MLVMVQVHEPRSGDDSEFLHTIKISSTLKFDRADKAAHRLGRQPRLHQSEKPLRIAHHVRKQPVDRPDRLWIEGECALAPDSDAGKCSDAWVEQGLVNADHAGAELLQDPGPAARTGTKIHADFVRLRLFTDQRE